MVFFTCNHCGESLKKAAVEKHYNFKCRGAKKNVSCMDCQKDFYDEEYVAHIKCITEAEKYSGKDYVPKEQKNSGQKKQESWMEIVRSIIDNRELSNEMKSAFQRLKAVENVPRKKAKFVNFVSNSMRMRANQAEEIWAVLDEELTRMKEAAQQNKTEDAQQPEEKNHNPTENQKAQYENVPPAEEQNPEDRNVEKAKNSKKRKVDKQVQNNIEEDEEQEILQMVAETVKKDELNSEPKKKKHKKRNAAAPANAATAAEATQEPTVSTTTDAFEWGLIMKYTVRQAAGGIFLETLKKKIQRMYFKKHGVQILTDEERFRFERKYLKYIKRCNFKIQNGVVMPADPADPAE